MRIYWIKTHFDGRLGMMARPRGNDWLESEVKKLRLNDVDIVVSLLETHEISELGLSAEARYCQNLNMNYFNYPIPDRGLPDSVHYFCETLYQLHEKLKEGSKMVVHCRIGIGRTSMLCAALLILAGEKPDNVFKLLSNARTLEVPDTPQQAKWIRSLRLR